MWDSAPQFRARSGAKQEGVCCRLNALSLRSPLARQLTSFTSLDILRADKLEVDSLDRPFRDGRSDTKVRAAAGGEEGVVAKSADKAQLLNSLKEAIATVSEVVWLHGG